jgi:hypothetical protein
MDGLEPSSIFHELLNDVEQPGVISWAVLSRNEHGIDVFYQRQADAFSLTPPDVFDNEVFNNEVFNKAATLTPELLRLGVQRILTGLCQVPDDVLFVLRAANHDELDVNTLDAIVQAALWGRIQI